MSALALVKLESQELEIPGADPWYAHPSDPALTVMTDFRERTSVTISESATIDAALEHMKHTGVRCAFATDDVRRVVVGMITAFDISSEKPLQHLTAVTGKREEILVRHIMQKTSEWRVVNVKEIERSTVESVRKIFEESRLTHIAVMETVDSGAQRLRGLLSAAKVRRLLGILV